SPVGRGLDRLIEEKRLYPVTILKSLSNKERDVLSDHGVITLKQLVEARKEDAGIPRSRIMRLFEEAESILAL
ncbi:MAG: hypothetical protein V1857_05915, partial [archaeon]